MTKMTIKKTHDPLSPRGYDAIRRYIEHAEAHERNPVQRPAPDLELLLIEPTHGPISAVALAVIDGEPQVSVSFHGRNPRFFDPLDYAALALGLAFGMGMSLNADGKGRTYPRLRVSRPTGRAIHFLRILTDAKPWEVARQAHGVDYHHLARSNLFKEPFEKVLEENKPGRPPLLGRRAFYRAVGRYWTLHAAKSGILVTLAEHLRLIRTALEIGDRREARRRAGGRDDTAGPNKAA